MISNKISDQKSIIVTNNNQVSQKLKEKNLLSSYGNSPKKVNIRKNNHKNKLEIKLLWIIIQLLKRKNSIFKK